MKTKKASLFLAVLAAMTVWTMSLFVPAAAESYTWTGSCGTTQWDCYVLDTTAPRPYPMYYKNWGPRITSLPGTVNGDIVYIGDSTMTASMTANYAYSGQVFALNTLNVGGVSSSLTATLNINSERLRSNTVNLNSYGYLNQTGGIFDATTYNVSGGTATMSDGTLNSTTLNIGTGSSFSNSGGWMSVTNMVNNGLFDQSDGVLSTQTVVTNGNFNFTGGNFNAMSLNNTGRFTGTGAITVSSFTNNGVLAPGNSPGSLQINGSYTQGSDGTLEIELGSSARDILDISGAATLAGILKIILYEGYTPSNGSYYDILTADGISGAFQSIDGPAGYAWTVSYLDLFGNDGKNDTARLTANAVPIPPAAWLLGTGLIGVIGIRRRFTA